MDGLMLVIATLASLYSHTVVEGGLSSNNTWASLFSRSGNLKIMLPVPPSLKFSDGNSSEIKSLTIQGVAKINKARSKMKIRLVIQGKPDETSPTQGGAGNTTTQGGAGNTTTQGGAGNTTTQGGAGNTTTGSADDEKALRAHNKFRKIHNEPPMVLDKELSKKAQAWAEKIAKQGKGEHDKQRGDVGENWNIACRPQKKSPEAAVETWYNEICQPGYQFEKEHDNPGGAGHFTQVIWKTSAKFGYGTAEGKYQGYPCTFSVGRYDLPGNYRQKYMKNVLKGSFDKSKYCSKAKPQKRHDLPRLYYTPDDVSDYEEGIL